jgi:hypothetical protein
MRVRIYTHRIIDSDGEAPLSTDAFKRYVVHIISCAFVQSWDHYYHVQVVKFSDELACLDFFCRLASARIASVCCADIRLISFMHR